MNLLKETIQCLEENGKTEEDVIWVGLELASENQYLVTWNEFKQKANIQYDNSYGSVCIPSGLMIIGEDFWLERHEYDGSEWWEYKTHPLNLIASKNSKCAGKRAKLHIIDDYRNCNKCDFCRKESE